MEILQNSGRQDLSSLISEQRKHARGIPERIRKAEFHLKDIPILIKGAVIPVLFGRLFYGSWVAVIILSPLIIPWFLRQKKMTDIRA